MIEIVIKISEKAYNALTHTEFDANLVVDEMRKAIANGTPLLKNHGRIIDADVALDYFTTNMNIIDEDDERIESDVERRKIFKDYFDGVKPILEADGSDKNEISN